MAVVRAAHWLDLWRDSPEAERLSYLQNAKDALDDPFFVPINHPQRWLLMGRLAYYRGIAEVNKSDIKRSLDHFRRSEQMRPLWPRSWAYEAAGLARLNNFEQRFDAVLEKALALGPNEAEVLKIIFPSLALRWYRLEPEQQQAVTEMVERIALTQDYWLIRMVGRYGYEWRFCDREIFRARTGAFCEQAGWTPEDVDPT